MIGTMGAGGRLRWTIEDGLTLVGREMRRMRHEPGELIAALVFPAVMVLMFGYVMGSAIKVPGGGDYREFLMPGLFAMITFGSVATLSVRMATDVSRGVMDRFRSMPMARPAVPFGQTGADVLTGALNLVVMAGMGVLAGWQPHDGPLRAVAAFALLGVLRYGLSWAGCYLGLVVKNEQTADQLMPLLIPLSMISNAYVPTEGMPAWLRVIADWNPISAVTAACRELFGNPGGPTADAAWPVAHPFAATITWSVLLVVIFMPLSVRAYHRKGR